MLKQCLKTKQEAHDLVGSQESSRTKWAEDGDGDETQEPKGGVIVAWVILDPWCVW